MECEWTRCFGIFEDSHCGIVKKAFTTFGVINALVNLVIIFALLKTQKIREKSGNIYIISILMVNLAMLAAMPFLKKVIQK